MDLNKIRENANTNLEICEKEISGIEKILELNTFLSKEELTEDQKESLLKIVKFNEGGRKYFLLAGFSGTGKTSIVENIVKYLGEGNCSILAPTNTAVKRLRDKLDHFNVDLKTIHSCIYGEPDEEGNWIPRSIEWGRKYIIDECSMIDKKILEDLLNLSEDYNCKLIFIGDGFQLEPVGSDPFLFHWENSKDFGYRFNEYDKVLMTEVKRTDNTIVTASNHIRTTQSNEILKSNDVIVCSKFPKQFNIDVKEKNDYAVIVSTNKRRLKYNNAIRQMLKYTEPFEKGDKFISIANNRRINGEIFTLENPELIWKKEASVNVGSVAYPKQKTYDFYFIRDDNSRMIFIPEYDGSSLYGQQLVETFSDYPALVIDGKRGLKWNKSVDIVTYGYSITAWKAQGNEFTNVYIDIDWLSDNINKERYMYTVLSRAKNKVYIIDNPYITYK